LFLGTDKICEFIFRLELCWWNSDNKTQGPLSSRLSFSIR
jgi:hypothetical protein